MTLIDVKQLTKKYEDRLLALDNVNLSIKKGEWLSIMGPSGSGKTTLLNIIGCLDSPTQGSVKIEGAETTKLSQKELTQFRRDNIGLIFQQFYLIPYLTALENVMVAQYYHSMADEDEAIEALKLVGLGDRLEHLPSQLSGGEQQRVCIARALINQPKLILADEPTGNLDEENENIVIDIFRQLHRKGHTIIVVTHDLEVGKEADRQIQLEHGRIVGAHLLPSQAQENIDDLLEELWVLREREKPLTLEFISKLGVIKETRAIVKNMATKSLIRLDNGSLSFTTEGEHRARDIVRRHRLGEILFSKTFEMDEKLVESSACHFEHSLSPEVTESICTFLEHPKTCPHGNPIPEGECCK